MDLFISSLHEYLLDARHRIQKIPVTSRGPKRYERMEAVLLPAPALLTATLSQVLAKRKSRRLFSGKSLNLAELSSLLFHAAHKNDHKRRPYPSGGGPYPVEIYLVSFSIEKCKRQVLHYEPDTHMLRYLWKIPEHLQHTSLMRLEGGSEPNVLIVMTAVWERNTGKYKDFGYVLSLLEAGHICQNILLCAEALSLAACPIGALNSNEVIPILDIDRTREQPVYAIALGGMTEM